MENININEEYEKLSWNEKLKVLRTIKKMSQIEAAEKCCTTQKIYWSWESGKSYPRKNSRRAIANAFQVKENQLFPKNDER